MLPDSFCGKFDQTNNEDTIIILYKFITQKKKQLTPFMRPEECLKLKFDKGIKEK